jgi:hypothetical protein
MQECGPSTPRPRRMCRRSNLPATRRMVTLRSPHIRRVRRRAVPRRSSVTARRRDRSSLVASNLANQSPRPRRQMPDEPHRTASGGRPPGTGSPLSTAAGSCSLSGPAAPLAASRGTKPTSNSAANPDAALIHTLHEPFRSRAQRRPNGLIFKKTGEFPFQASKNSTSFPSSSTPSATWATATPLRSRPRPFQPS